jgi:hypothetical protein
VCENGRKPAPIFAKIEPDHNDLLHHIEHYPMKGKMQTVEEWMTEMKAAAKANGHWPNRFWPAIYVAAGVAVYIAAMHATEVLKVAIFGSRPESVIEDEGF